jgi:hypothetical protein
LSPSPSSKASKPTRRESAGNVSEAAADLDDGDAARYWEEWQENKVAKGELNKGLQGEAKYWNNLEVESPGQVLVNKAKMQGSKERESKGEAVRLRKAGLERLNAKDHQA